MAYETENGAVFATNQKVTPVQITVRAKGFNKTFWFYGGSAQWAWAQITEQFNYVETTAATNGRKTTRTRRTQEEKETVAA